MSSGSRESNAKSASLAYFSKTEKFGSLKVISLTCANGRSLYGTAWMEEAREQANIAINEMKELNANILKETGGAASLVSLGPTRDDAATALMKLNFYAKALSVATPSC